MKIYLIPSSVVALLLPGLALAAAYNDVSISGSTNFSVNGITVAISGATLSQVTADATTFSVTLGPGSSVYLSAPSLNQMTLSTGGSDFLSSSVCDGSASNMTLVAPASAATTTVTVTPSSTLCATNAGGGGGGSGSSSGGGGGGGGSVILATPVNTITPESAATTAATNNANLTTEQRTTLIAQLTVQLNALLAQIAVLRGESPASTGSFSRDLETGATGSDVKALQQYLNNHGFDVASSGAGSAGNETERFGGLTRAALIKLQKSAGITPAVGYFGPKTRAYIAAHP